MGLRALSKGELDPYSDFRLMLSKAMKRREFIIWLVGALTAWPCTARAAAGERRNPSLTAVQRSEIWRALRNRARKTQEAAGLHIGEVVPDTLNVLSFGHSLHEKIPAIRPYRYTLLHDQVLIVDPRTKKIASIIGR
jgi:hypothetical protein